MMAIVSYGFSANGKSNTMDGDVMKFISYFFLKFVTYYSSI